MIDIAPGTLLDDSRIYSNGESFVVYATLIEDIDKLELDGGFTVQDADWACSICNVTPNIRMLHTTMNGHRNLCIYCTNCNILYRTVMIGVHRWGEYYPFEEYM